MLDNKITKFHLIVDETRNLLNGLLNGVNQLNIVEGYLWLEVEG